MKCKKCGNPSQYKYFVCPKCGCVNEPSESVIVDTPQDMRKIMGEM